MTATAHSAPPSSGNAPATGTPASDSEDREPLALVPSSCFVCNDDDAEPVAVGQDFDFATSPDSFLAVRCSQCGLVYLNPWPAPDQLDRIHRAKRDSARKQGFEPTAWGSSRTWVREIDRF